MIIDEALGNLSEIVEILPPQIVDSIGGMILILKAVGVVFIVYILYLIVMGFLKIKSAKRVKSIEKMVISMDRKIDKLLKGKKKKK